VAAALLGLVASAQSAPAAPLRLPAFYFEDPLVVARKREEPLQSTPLSVTALPEAQIRSATAHRLDDLRTLVPNLQMDADDTGANARLQMRGAGTSDWLVTRDPAVGVYLDGVYLSRAQGSLLDLGDVERVEVIRGPQGTLYGRNTIGGAVNVITRKPASAPRGDASLRFGDHRLAEGRASLTGPLLEGLLLGRLSLVSRTRRGYTHNELLGEHTDDDRLFGGRAALRLLPSETLTLDLAGDFTREHHNGRGGQCRFSASSPAATGVVSDPQGQGAPQPIPTLVGPVPDMFTGFSSRCRASQVVGDLEYLSDVDSDSELDTLGLTGTGTWNVTESLELKSISSWRRVEQGRNQEFDYTPSAFGRLDGEGDQLDAWSQELSLSGSAWGGDLEWTAGLYGFWEKANPGRELSLIGTDPALRPLLLFMFGDPLFFSYAAVNATQNQNFAGYGQVTWNATPRLALTAGLRRLVERKQWDHRRHGLVGDPDFPQLGPVQIQADTAERFDAWTGLLNAAWRASDSVLLYAQWANGYKSGGFNGRTNPSDLTTLEPYDPEKLDSYELGLKSSWLDQSLTVNVSAFHSIYRDIQQTVFKSAADGSFASVVRNAARATVRGAEIEARARPLAPLSLFASLGIIDAKYEENERASRYLGPDGAPLVLDRRDEDFLNTPAYTLALGAAYDLSTRWGVLTPSLTWYAQSKVNYAPAEDIQGSSYGVQGKYGLLDGRLSLKLRDGRTEIAIWGRNLLDRRYQNSALDFTDGFAVTDVFFGAPRMLGVEIRVGLDL
jgi:iron complex outermembrane receptor protein